MAGRPRLSKEEKIKRGTYAPSRDIENPKYKKVKKIPPAPGYMNKYSKEIYKAIAADLHEAELLTDSNFRLVCAYASEMGNYTEMEEQMSKMESRFVEMKNKDGEVYSIIQHPIVKTSNQYYNNAVKLAPQLGFTPASISKIPVRKPKKEDNPFEDLN